MKSGGTHKKLHFPRGGTLPLYADLIQFGGASRPAPLLLHLGGAAGMRAYRAREHTAPEPIIRVVERAIRATGLERLDLIVCPDQPDTSEEGGGRSIGRVWWEQHYDRLLHEVGGSRTSLGLVGFSAGGPTAVYLGLVEDVRAVATLGGAGTIRAFDKDYRDLVEKRRQEGWTGFDLAIYRNSADQVDQPSRVAAAAPRPIRSRAFDGAPGGHGFWHYAANGAAEGAYRFVLERLLHNPDSRADPGQR